MSSENAMEISIIYLLDQDIKPSQMAGFLLFFLLEF
jgi:hypothetical protein